MSVIFLFGPSCAGKSTLGKALAQSLGREWHYIDRDELIEQRVCREEGANVELDARIFALREKIIIDAQIPWRQKQREERYFLILPPLSILLERDGERTRELSRDQLTARAARRYVCETHATLSSMKPCLGFDECFDSSKMSVEQEVESIKTHIPQPDEFFGSTIKCLLVAGLVIGVLSYIRRYAA